MSWFFYLSILEVLLFYGYELILPQFRKKGLSSDSLAVELWTGPGEQIVQRRKSFIIDDPIWSQFEDQSVYLPLAIRTFPTILC